MFVKYKRKFCYYIPECFPKYQVSIWKICSRKHPEVWYVRAQYNAAEYTTTYILRIKSHVPPTLQIMSHSLRIPFFWDMTLHQWIIGYQCFNIFQCPLLQGSNIYFAMAEIFIFQGMKCRFHFDP